MQLHRQETAASVTYLAHLLRKSTSPLRVLDLCTGTGCIPLLFHDEFYSNQRAETGTVATGDQPSLDLLGVDISSQALSLARENLIHQIANQAHNHQPSQQRTRSLHRVGFIQADVSRVEESLLPALQRLSSHEEEDSPPTFDVLISNPPYVSPKAHLPRSVRLYEPRLALIPSVSSPADKVAGDEFYPALLRAADAISVKVLLFEVGDMEQAVRVAEMAVEQGLWEMIEIWRDHPSGDSQEVIEIAGRQIVVRGEGKGRSVFAIRGEAVSWFDRR